MTIQLSSFPARHGLFKRTLLIAAGLMVCGVLAARTEETNILNDVAHYMSVAKNVAAGQGIVTDVGYYDLQHRLGKLPVPLTDWPAGYPILLVPFVAVGIPAPRAALFVSYAACWLSALVVVSIQKQHGINRFTSWLLAALFFTHVPMWYFARVGGAESSMLLFTLLSFLCVARWEHCQRWKWLVAAGLCAGIAFSMRYAGLFYIAALGLYFGGRWLFRPSKSAFADLLIVVAATSLLVLPVLIRNILEVGSLFGRPSASLPTSLSLVSQVTWTISFLTGLTKDTLRAGELPDLLTAIGLLGICGLLVKHTFQRLAEWSRARKGSANSELNDKRLPTSPVTAEGPASVPMLAIVYVAFGSISLFVCAALFQFEYVQARYFLAFVPYVGIAVTTIVSRGGTCNWYLVAALLLSCTAHFRTWQINDPAVAVNQQLREDLQAKRGNLTLRQLLQNAATQESPVVSNLPQELALAISRPTLGVASTAFSVKEITSSNGAEFMQRFGARYLVFVKAGFDQNDPLMANQRLFADLQNKRIPTWLKMIYSDPQIALFERTAE